MSPSVREGLKQVQEKIALAEKKANRKPGSVLCLAASKMKSAEMVVQAAQLGIVNFGENYVQEATKKIEQVRSSYPNLKVHWHLIGNLQTNKSKFVVGLFDTIQSVDRFELAKAINSRALEAGVIQKIFLQIKLGDEPSKGGIIPEKAPELINQISTLSQLRLEGLMSLPPIEAEAEGSRKYFRQLREWRDKWQLLMNVADRGTLKELSMGTTHDFEIAIEEGATMIRVGTAIFGER